MNAAQKTIVMHLEPEDQRRVLEQARDIIRQAPLVRPSTPGGTPMRVRVSAAGALGWVGDGAYRYSPAQRDGRPWPPLPQLWRDLNWYAPDAGLGWHRDLAEKNQSLPIVTISLGDCATWAIREDDQSPVSRCRVESGDVTLLDGPRRLWLHSIERLHSNPLLSPLSEPGRLSITIRVAG